MALQLLLLGPQYASAILTFLAFQKPFLWELPLPGPPSPNEVPIKCGYLPSVNLPPLVIVYLLVRRSINECLLHTHTQTPGGRDFDLPTAYILSL